MDEYISSDGLRAWREGVFFDPSGWVLLTIVDGSHFLGHCGNSKRAFIGIDLGVRYVYTLMHTETTKCNDQV